MSCLELMIFAKGNAPPEKQWRWDYLEGLDSVYFRGGTLTNNNIKSRQRAKSLYEAACIEAGLQAYEHV